MVMAWNPFLRHVFLVVTLAASFQGGQALQVPDEQRLYKRIMGNYVKTVKPIVTKSDPLQVLFSIRLKQIVDLDERKQVLTTNVFIDQTWIDPSLAWNVSEFEDVVSLRIPAEQIWKPDTFIFNNADNGSTGFIHGKFVQIRHNGAVTWPVPVRLRSSCVVKIAYFPFDYQYCWVQFGSWIYSHRFVDYTIRPDAASVDLATYINNSEWALLAMRINKTVDFRSRSSEVHPYLTMSLYLRRNTFFYLFNIIVPCIMLSMLTLMTFWLPPTSGEKVTLGLSVFLAFSMFMLLIADEVPASSDAVPIIGIYLCVVMTMTSLSVIFAVLVTNLYHRGNKLRPPPRWLACVCIRVLAVLVGVSRDIQLLASTIHLPDHCQFYLIHNKFDLINYKMSNYDQYCNKPRSNEIKGRSLRRQGHPSNGDNHYVFDHESSESPGKRGPCAYMPGYAQTPGNSYRSRAPKRPLGSSRVMRFQGNKRPNVSTLTSDDQQQYIQLDALDYGQGDEGCYNELIAFPGPTFDCAQRCPQISRSAKTLQESQLHVPHSRLQEGVNAPNSITGQCRFDNLSNISSISTSFDDKSIGLSSVGLQPNETRHLNSDVLSSDSETFHDNFLFHDQSVDHIETAFTLDPERCEAIAADAKMRQIITPTNLTRNLKSTSRRNSGHFRCKENHLGAPPDMKKPLSLPYRHTNNSVKAKPLPPIRRSSIAKDNLSFYTNESAVERSIIRAEFGFIENDRPNIHCNSRSGSSEILEPCSCISQTVKNPKYAQARVNRNSTVTSICHPSTRTSNEFLSSSVKNSNPFSTCISLPPTPILSSFGSIKMPTDSSLVECCSRPSDNFQPPTNRSSGNFSENDANRAKKPIAISNKQPPKDSPQVAKLQYPSSPTKSIAPETFCECTNHSDDVWLPRDQVGDCEDEDVWLLREDFIPGNTQEVTEGQLQCNATHILSNPNIHHTGVSNMNGRNQRHSSATLRHLEQYLDARSRLVLSKARMMVAEWQTIATVVDRLLFCITFFATVFAYIFLFVIAPHEHNSLHSDLNLTLSASAGRFDWTS